MDNPSKQCNALTFGTTITMQAVPGAFNQLLFEANRLLKKEGLLCSQKRFLELSALLVIKLIDERQAQGLVSKGGVACKLKFSWQQFSNLEPAAMLQALNQVMLPHLARTYHPPTDFFQKKSSIKDPVTLKKLVDKLSALNLLAYHSNSLGEAFEYFLHQDPLSHKQNLGIYFTPAHIVHLVLDLVKLKPGDKIYDPTCGAGNFLIAAYQLLQKQSQASLLDPTKKILFGREISNPIHLAKLALLIVGANPSSLSQMDTLKVPLYNQFSVILANFPFSQRTQYSALYGLEGKEANPVFLKHIIDALAPQGRAAVIVPDRLLFNQHLDYLKVRKILLETCQVLGIIQLPAHVFMPYTKQPTSLLIFKKGGRSHRVWFFEMVNEGFKKTQSLLGRTPSPRIENDLALLKALWKNKPDSPRSFSVELPTLVKENYHLSLNRYKRLLRSIKNGVRLGEVCDIVIRATPRRNAFNFDNGRHLFVRIGDLNQRVIKNTHLKLTDQGIKQSGIKPLQKHTLLLSLRFTLGKTAFAGKRVYTSEGIAGLLPKDHRVLPQYLYYVLPHLDYSPYANRNVRGQDLTRATLEDLQLPLPPLSVQKKLVRLLDQQEAKKQHYLKKIDRLIRFKDKKIKDLIQERPYVTQSVNGSRG